MNYPTTDQYDASQSSWRENRQMNREDAALRAAGFEINQRRGNSEPVWFHRKLAHVVPHREALELVKRWHREQSS